MIPPRPNDNTSAAAQGAIGESSPVAAPRFAPRTAGSVDAVVASGSRLAPSTAGTAARGVAASGIVGVGVGPGVGVVFNV